MAGILTYFTRAASFRWHARLVLFATLTGIVTASPADERELEQVTSVGTRAEVDALDGPGAVGVLNERELRFIAPVHIQESLLRIPGVNLHRGNGQEYLPAIRSPVLTGAGACGSFLTAEDNIPLRAAGFCNVNELFDAHSEQARRIEVLRGPGTALHGSNAMTGVVNVVLPRAPGGRVSVEAGPHDYARLKLAGGSGDRDNRLGAYLTASHDGGYRDDSGFKQYKLSVRHDYRGDAVRAFSGLTIAYLDQETAGFIVGRDAYLDPDVARTNLNPEAFRESLAVRAWSRLEHDFSDRATGVLTPYFRYTDMDFLQHFLPGDPLEENAQRGVGWQSALYFNAAPGLRWIGGLDAEFTRGELRQTQKNPTSGSAFLRETIPAGKHYDYRVDAVTLAPFVHAEWAFAERWTLHAGLRFEYTRYAYDNRMLAGRTRDDGTACGFGGCRYSRPADRTDRFGNLSPKLELQYAPGDRQRVYLNLSTGFRAPQATELYRLQRDQRAADLGSENVRSVELGYRSQARALNFDIAAYAMKKRNVIFRDSDFFNVDGGETEHLGLELALGWAVSQYFDLGLTASLARHRYRNDRISNGININGNDVDTAPREFGSLRAGWTPTERTRVELEWIHMGDYFLDPENRHTYPGHDVLTLRASQEFGDGWRLAARISNLSDERYAERADFTTFTEERYFPGEPRSLYLEVEKRFSGAYR